MVTTRTGLSSILQEAGSLRAGRLALLVIWLLLHIFFRTSFFNDCGTYSHTMYGNVMLHSGSLIRIDPFTCSRFGQPWIAQQWLSEVGMALLSMVGGFDTLLLAATLLTALTFTGIWIRLYNSGMHLLITVLIMAMVFSAASIQFLIRPLLITMAALAVLFAMLVDIEAGRRPVSHLLLLLPMFWIWANSHGGYLAGIGTFGLTVAGWTALRLSSVPTPLSAPRRVFIAWASLFLACAMSFLGPYGVELPKTWATIMDSAEVRALIIEHMPIYTTSDGVVPILLFLGYIAFLAKFGERPLRITWVIPIVWFLLAWSRVRNAPLFAITAAIALAEIYSQSSLLKEIAERKPLYGLVKDRLPAKLPLRTATVLLLAGFWLQASGSALPLLGTGWAKPDDARWPFELVPVIRAYAERKTPNKAVFTEFNLGSWAVGVDPRLRVTIDDRCELFGDRLMREHYESASNTRLIASWVRSFSTTAALTSPDSGFDRWFRSAPGWRVVATAPAGVWHELDTGEVPAP